jgi:phosphate transport system permease protein
MEAGGIFPAIFGTVFLVILMVICVVPLGVLTAIYLQEYTRPDSAITRLIRIAIANLAGVPSIVFGLFGLGFFIGFIGSGMDSLFYGESSPVWGQPAIIWAALTLSLLTLPVVIIATEEALRTVPAEMKDASYALGATKLQTIRRVIMPQALPGVLTGGILAVSRGAGEVAPIMFTGAAYYLPYLPTKLNDQFMELGYHIYVMATQSPDVEATKPILYGTVLVLLLLTFMLNLTAIMIRSKMRKARANVQ